MKKKKHLRSYRFASGALALFLTLPGLCQAAAPQAFQSSTAPIDESNPQTAILAAEERFKQAEKEFTASENAEARAALGPGGAQTGGTPHESSFMAPATTTPLNSQPPARETPARPKSGQTPRQDVQFGTGPEYMGSPQTGYSATWKEPGSGDVMTSVIAPSEPVQTTPVYPMVIEPLVNGSDWSGQGNSWSSGGSWPGGYPGAPGINPGFGPGGQQPPPPNHNYRPLRPNNPSLWNPGMGPNFGPGGRPPQAMGPGAQQPPAFQPPQPQNPGFQPQQPPYPGFQPQQPGTPQPGPGWGQGAPQNPGFQPQPGQPPVPPGNWRPGPGSFQPGQPQQPGPAGWQGGMPATMRPLPMTPPGSTWGRPAPMGGRPHGGF